MKNALIAFNELNEFNKENKNLFIQMENNSEGEFYIKVRPRLNPLGSFSLKKIMSISRKNKGKLTLEHLGTIKIKFQN